MIEEGAQLTRDELVSGLQELIMEMDSEEVRLFIERIGVGQVAEGLNLLVSAVPTPWRVDAGPSIESPAKDFLIEKIWTGGSSEND